MSAKSLARESSCEAVPVLLGSRPRLQVQLGMGPGVVAVIAARSEALRDSVMPDSMLHLHCCRHGRGLLCP